MARNRYLDVGTISQRVLAVTCAPIERATLWATVRFEHAIGRSKYVLVAVA